MPRPIEIRTSPHLKRALTVPQIMRGVVIALLPICAFAIFQFGLSALLLLATTTGVAMATEYLFSRLSDRGNTLGDWSVVITGLLLGLTLPPGFPLWMAAVAAFVGVGLGKSLFGGLGFNVMNAALVGRAFTQAAFPVAITSWTPGFAPGRFLEVIPSTLTPPLMQPTPVKDWIAGLGIDGFTGATPLALQKFQHIETSTLDLFTGMVSGSAGETSALLILICGMYLAMPWSLGLGDGRLLHQQWVCVTGPEVQIHHQGAGDQDLVAHGGGIVAGDGHVVRPQGGVAGAVPQVQEVPVHDVVVNLYDLAMELYLLPGEFCLIGIKFSDALLDRIISDRGG